jgi:Fe-S-cluster containining protein
MTSCVNPNGPPLREDFVDCDGCGACCRTMGAPPGYVVVVMNPEAWPQYTGDHERVDSLPDEAKSELLDHISSDLWAEGDPCLWLDQNTGRCRWYEYRPSVCREFRVGSPECLAWRDRFDV